MAEKINVFDVLEKIYNDDENEKKNTKVLDNESTSNSKPQKNNLDTKEQNNIDNYNNSIFEEIKSNNQQLKSSIQPKSTPIQASEYSNSTDYFKKTNDYVEKYNNAKVKYISGENKAKFENFNWNNTNQINKIYSKDSYYTLSKEPFMDLKDIEAAQARVASIKKLNLASNDNQLKLTQNTLDSVATKVGDRDLQLDSTNVNNVTVQNTNIKGKDALPRENIKANTEYKDLTISDPSVLKDKTKKINLDNVSDVDINVRETDNIVKKRNFDGTMKKNTAASSPKSSAFKTAGKYALGALAGAALVGALFFSDNKGEQTNAQLYGQQPLY